MAYQNQKGFLASQLLKQAENNFYTTPVNILISKIFKCGHELLINDIITDTFTKIDNTVPTLPLSAGSYYFDITDNFKLKDNTSSTVPDGYYKLKSNVNYFSINKVGWHADTYYVYYVKNGLPFSFAAVGYYVDLIHNIILYVDNNHICNNAPNGYYFLKNPCNILISTENIIIPVPNGTYFLKFLNNINITTIIYDVVESIPIPYNNYFVNLDNFNYYNSQKLFGECESGCIILTVDKIFIRILNEWKYFDLKSLI